MADENEAKAYLESQGLTTETLEDGRHKFRGLVGGYRRVIVGKSWSELAEAVRDWPVQLG